ncbi:SRPBCC domain-containing protein [Niabella soli]|uniref:Activator of HSP90 ATPase n=1 Tax=Niabella soli DSM 19437 TaxID=929713 RepID=W0F0V7_9BACT|nr:SRPBCC domain-containing protein [Niabella soli]AHF15468.1 activator of HSP90 ATPase [Niabella soli DSM 19437]
MDDLQDPITVEVIVNRPIAEVWRKWTTSEAIMQWNLPMEHWHCPKVENNITGGGSFCFRMEAKDGTEGFDYRGVYNKVVEKQLIEAILSDGRRTVNKFIPGEGFTTVIESFEPERELSAAMQKSFCQSVLNRFKEYVEKKG